MTDKLRHMVPAAEPTASQPGVFLCQYCGTECADVEARDKHEPICPQNPASEYYWNRKADQAAAVNPKK